MADSNITKKALASAFKDLLAKKPFERITVGEICLNCEMNRKSFYYHFKDKYDLVYWIFDSEFLVNIQTSSLDWSWFEIFCDYLYENRKFYRKVLTVEGQNSFTDYLEEVLSELFSASIANVFSDEKYADFCTAFYCDAFICAIKRWLIKSDHALTGKDLCSLLKKSVIDLPRS